MGNLGRAYNVIWSQYTQQMRAKIEPMAGYDAIHAASDVLGLLNLIRLDAFDFHTNQNTYITVIEVKKVFKNFWQK